MWLVDRLGFCTVPEKGLFAGCDNVFGPPVWKSSSESSLRARFTRMIFTSILGAIFFGGEKSQQYRNEILNKFKNICDVCGGREFVVKSPTVHTCEFFLVVEIAEKIRT